MEEDRKSCVFILQTERQVHHCQESEISRVVAVTGVNARRNTNCMQCGQYKTAISSIMMIPQQLRLLEFIWVLMLVLTVLFVLQAETIRETEISEGMTVGIIAE